MDWTTMNRTRVRATFLQRVMLFAALLCCMPAGQVAVADEVSEAISEAIGRSLDQVAEDADFDAAVQRHAMILDQTIAFAPGSDKKTFRDAGFTLRLVDQLGKVKSVDSQMLLRQLREMPTFARALAFAIKPEIESPDEVYTLAHRMIRERGERIERYANLAAAICVVHDKPMTQRINENTARSADPVAIFDYFVASEERLLFGIKEIPAELLVYVVDTTASISEMQWALANYEGDRNVGARFFDIKYDHDHFREGTPKKVTQAGWNLRNIKRLGGVCADQAYFAMTVGKAIGVPTTYTTGQSSEVGHAWVGFLQADRNSAWWNFDTGRSRAYQGVRGNVLDPQLRRVIPDSYISLHADFVQASALDRQFAAAATDAARRLALLEETGVGFSPPSIDERERRPIRTASLRNQLELLETGLRACPGYADAWFTVRQLASEERLTLKEKERWAEVLHRLCGKRYPDFYLAVAAPMIQTIDDPRQQNKLWNAAFRTFAHRSDLAAAVRMAQAELWEAQGEQRKAGQCYEDVISRFANAGPFVLSALRGAEAILREQGDGRKVLALYEQTWARIERPGQMGAEFARQSNWFKVGMMYAQRLDEAGLSQQAADVLGTITGGR